MHAEIKEPIVQRRFHLVGGLLVNIGEGVVAGVSLKNITYSYIPSVYKYHLFVYSLSI
jgi:hypothetical protein